MIAYDIDSLYDQNVYSNMVIILGGTTKEKLLLQSERVIKVKTPD